MTWEVLCRRAWSIATSRATLGFHSAFPEALAKRAVLAGCPERTCLVCGQPWQRAPVDRQLGHLPLLGELLPGCTCHGGWQPGLVLDPFMGSGTTAVVAEQLERDWLGIELNPEFVALARGPDPPRPTNPFQRRAGEARPDAGDRRMSPVAETQPRRASARYHHQLMNERRNKPWNNNHKIKRR